MPGTLTIAFVPGVSPAKWARVWRDRFPDVELVLRPVGATEVSAALAGSVDMCFVRLPVADDLAAIPLWTETPVVATPRDSALGARDELTEADLVGQHRLGAGPVPEDVDATLDLVATGVGYAVLPQSLFRAASRKELVGRPLVDAEGTRIALAWREQDASALTEEFIGVVRGRTANSSRGQETTPEAAPTATTSPKSTKGGQQQGGQQQGGGRRGGGNGGAGRTGNGRTGNGRPGARGAGGARGRSQRRGR